MCVSVYPKHQYTALSKSVSEHTHFDRVYNLDDARMSDCPQLAKRILGEGKSGLVGGDVEAEDAAFRAVVLEDNQYSVREEWEE